MLSRDARIAKILETQQTLSDLTMKVDMVKNENSQLREENNVLKDYIENLVNKLGYMPKLGTAPPSEAVKKPVDARQCAHAVRVNDHIGDLTAPEENSLM